MATINRKIIKLKQTKVKFDNDDKPAKYYSSKSWKKMREDYFKQNPLCENCMKNGIIKPGAEVHHKQIFSYAMSPEGKWNLFLDQNNLMTLCRSCHERFHKYARKHNLNYIDYLKPEIDFRKI